MEDKFFSGASSLYYALALRSLSEDLLHPEDSEPRPWPPGPVSLIEVFQDHCFYGRPLAKSLQLAGYQNTPEVLQQLKEEAALEFARDLACLNEENRRRLWETSSVSRILEENGVNIPVNLKTASATGEEVAGFFLSLSNERLQELLFTGARRERLRQERPPDVAPVEIKPLPPPELLPSDPYGDEIDRGWNELTKAVELLYDEGAPPTLHYIGMMLAAVSNLNFVISLAVGAFIRQGDELVGGSILGVTGRQEAISPTEAFLERAQKLDTPEGRKATIEFFSWAQRAAEEGIARARRLLEIGEGNEVGLRALINSKERWRGLFGGTINFLEKQ